MNSEPIDRRTILKALALLNVAPRLSAAAFTPKFFSAQRYATLQSLCRSIIPDGEESGIAEMIDLLASENEDYQTRLGGGLIWLDSTCHGRFGHTYFECTHEQQRSFLDLIAYRENAAADPALSPGVAFFSFLRDLTLAGYFTSEAGMKFLGYSGNHFLSGFPGCPPLPDES